VLVIPTIAEDAQLSNLVRMLTDTSNGVVLVSGLWGSSAPYVTAHVANHIRSPIVYITAHLEVADSAREDLELFSNRSCTFFPAWEALPGEGPASGEINAERLALCSLWQQANARSHRSPSDLEPIVVTPIQALMQPVPSREQLTDSTLTIEVERTKNKEKITHTGGTD